MSEKVRGLFKCLDYSNFERSKIYDQSKNEYVNYLSLRVGTAIEFGYQYELSFMGFPAFLALLMLCIALIYFLDSWFYMIWGLLTGIIVFVPIIIALFINTGNIASFIFGGILSTFLFIFFGVNLYKKVNKEPSCINKLYKKFKS